MLKDLYEETWRELAAGAKFPDHPFRTCTLATLEDSEIIKQRIVILREITEEKTLLFYTDKRSSKVDHVMKNAKAGALFYNPKIPLQIFVRGKILIHDSGEICEEHKSKIEGRSINDYNTQYAPGKKINNPVDVKRTKELNFAVLEMLPEVIEYLKLRAEPNRLRAIFTKKEEEWEKSYLIP